MIRNATLDDIPEALELAREMHQESRAAKFDFSEYRVATLLEQLITGDDGIVLVNEVNNRINGGLIAQVFTQYWGYTKSSQDLALFLTKEARGGIVYLKFIKEYVRQAKLKGVEDILIGVTSGINTDMVDSLYKYAGFLPIGNVYAWWGKE